MSQLRPGEWAPFAACFPDATLVDAADGSTVVFIAALSLSIGWSMKTSPVWFVVPVGYPAAQPDCFWASAELRLSSGAAPSNSGEQIIPGLQQPALWFSWHLTTWRPAHDDLTTYARFIQRRFADAR